MTKPIRVGIAGLGRSGWNIHAYSLAQLPEHYQISAVMDPDAKRRDEAEVSFNCETYSTYEQLIASDTELIVVATPSQFHKEHSIAASQAGKHVIVEKPMANNVSEADAMIAAAEAAATVLTVNQNYRYKPAARKVSEVIASGKLGEIVQIRMAVHQFGRRWDWQTLRKNNGGILTNHGAHMLDWMLLQFEDDDPDIFAYLVDTPLYAGDADSHAKVIIKPKDGPLLDAELTHCNAYGQPHWLVLGTQGSLTGTHQKLSWKYFNPADVAPLKLDEQPTADRSYNREALPFQEESVEFPNIQHSDTILLYQELFQAISNNTAPAISAASVRRQMLLFDKCREVAGWV